MKPPSINMTVFVVPILSACKTSCQGARNPWSARRRNIRRLALTCAESFGVYMGVSKNRGTPKSSILIGFSLINHPFWGTFFLGGLTPIYFFVFFLGWDKNQFWPALGRRFAPNKLCFLFHHGGNGSNIYPFLQSWNWKMSENYSNFTGNDSCIIHFPLLHGCGRNIEIFQKNTMWTGMWVQTNIEAKSKSVWLQDPPFQSKCFVNLAIILSFVGT